jgi:hypothetical protein
VGMASSLAFHSSTIESIERIAVGSRNRDLTFRGYQNVNAKHPYSNSSIQNARGMRDDVVDAFKSTKPFFIYEGVDPETCVAFYVGRTNNLKRRSGEHNRSKYKIRELLKLKNFSFREVVRPVPELPCGCHSSDAAELESFFIFNRNTIYDPLKNPTGCNLRLGDHAKDMSPGRYQELIEMFATTGYVWPEKKCAAPKTVSDELATARGVENVIGSLLGEARIDGDNEAVEALEVHFALAKVERIELEKDWYGARSFAELVLNNYKTRYVDAVDLTALSAELNCIKDKLKDDTQYEDLAGVITALGLVASPDKHRKVSSTAAAGFLEGVVAMIGTREEEKLTWTATNGTNENLTYRVRDGMYALRDWTCANGMQMPMKTANDHAEIALATFLEYWSSVTPGGDIVDLNSCKVLMRDVIWFRDYVRFVVNAPIPFKWRLDWFPPGHYVRFCMKTKYIDTCDIFGVACASGAAAKVANSAYLGRQKLEATAATNEFSPISLRYVRWNRTRSVRKILPVGAMKRIISNMTTPSAKRLLPELKRLVNELDDGRVVPERVEDTAARPLGQLSSVSDAEVGTLETNCQTTFGKRLKTT